MFYSKFSKKKYLNQSLGDVLFSFVLSSMYTLDEVGKIHGLALNGYGQSPFYREKSNPWSRSTSGPTDSKRWSR